MFLKKTKRLAWLGLSHWKHLTVKSKELKQGVASSLPSGSPVPSSSRFPSSDGQGGQPYQAAPKYSWGEGSELVAMDLPSPFFLPSLHPRPATIYLP